MQSKRDDFDNVNWVEIIWLVLIGVFGRLIPHIPNVSPITGLSLFAGAHLPRKLSFLIIGITLFASDLCLALIFGYPIISYFTIYTYTGFFAIAFIGSKLKFSRIKLFPFYVLGASFGFWIWTNFGVWLTSGFYAKTLSGLIMCYYMALPFLRNALIGDLIWSSLIFGIFYISLKRKIANRQECFNVNGGCGSHFKS